MAETTALQALKQNADQCQTNCKTFMDRTGGWFYIGREVTKLEDDRDKTGKALNTGYNLCLALSYVPVIGQIAAIIFLAKFGLSFLGDRDSMKARLIITAIGLGPLCIIADAVCSTATAILAKKALNANEKYDQARMLPQQ